MIAHLNPSVPSDLADLWRRARAAGLVPPASEVFAAALAAQLEALGPDWTPPPPPPPTRTAAATSARRRPQ